MNVEFRGIICSLFKSTIFVDKLRKTMNHLSQCSVYLVGI